MRLRYSFIAEEKRWANCKTSGISFPCHISANRFSTTTVVNAFRSRLSSKSGKISSSVEETRSSVCIVNFISRAVCTEHTPSGPWRILSLACSPRHLSYLYFTVPSEIAHFFDSGDSFCWMKLFLLVFSFCIPKVFRNFWRFSKNTNGPLGLVTILNLPTAISQKNTVLSSLHTEVGWYNSALLLSVYPRMHVPARHWTAFSVKENVSTVFEETSVKTRHAWPSKKWLHRLARNHQCCLSVHSQAVHSRYMYYLRPHWRCGQFACNKIFLHSPYKMKQHRAYSVLLRPRKPEWQSILWRGEAVVPMPLKINRACRTLRVDWSSMKNVRSPVLKCKAVGFFTPFLMTIVPFCVFWMDSPEIWRELSFDWSDDLSSSRRFAFIQFERFFLEVFL